jgi:heme A synthase
MGRLTKLSLSSLFVLFGLIFIGGYVSSSGVGLTCPNWPLCPHGLIPSSEFIIEYIHRSVAATSGVLVLLTMAFTLRSKIAPKPMKIASVIAGGAVVAQISLGGVVIVETLQPLLVTGHLGLGLVLFSMSLMTVLYAYRLESKKALEARTR